MERENSPAAGVSTRKRSRLTSTAATTSGPSLEAITLQSAMREIRELREERLQQRADFGTQLRQHDEQRAVFEAQLRERDEALRGMEQRIRLLDNNNQVSRPINRNFLPNIAPNFERDARVNINTELGFKLKPDIFDGTVPLREFFSQFELIARANRWSDAAKSVALISCLRGKARAVLECVVNIENLDYAELKSKLELRFGEGLLSQSYYSQFTNRKQKLGEDEATLGSDIERLSQLAYPECTYEVRDKIACAQFVTALSNGFVRRTLQLEGITSLKMAIQRAMAVKVIQESNFERRNNNFNFGNNNNNKNNFAKGRRFNNFDFGDRNNFNKFDGKRNFGNPGAGDKAKERKQEQNKNFYKSSNSSNNKMFVKECWQCGGSGHFRAECPFLKKGGN
ncbi:hypothetical protein ACS0PU_002683 [Formica fusca]